MSPWYTATFVFGRQRSPSTRNMMQVHTTQTIDLLAEQFFAALVPFRVTILLPSSVYEHATLLARSNPYYLKTIL
jgi:hypothetical protein